MKVVLDIETNGLVSPDVIHCIVCKDVSTNNVYRFVQDEVKTKFISFWDSVDTVIGHNIIQYDLLWLFNLLGLTTKDKAIVDTLLLSYLLRYDLKAGHSLEAWGNRLGIEKVGLDIDFSQYSTEIVERCERDVEINFKLYEFLKKKILDRKEFKQAVETEHQMAAICLDMHLNGFFFNIEGATKLRDELTDKLALLDAEIKTAFPPKLKFLREYTPKLTKHGTISRTTVPRDWTDLTTLSPDAPFSLVTWKEFNPGSTEQIVERLNDAGWKPTDKTATGQSFKVNETNLATLPDTAPDGARKLVERLLVAGRWRTLNEWINNYNPDTGRIHARFNTIGTWTHRMSHKSPNLGNVAAPKSIKYNGKYLKALATDLGSRMRSLWTCPTGKWLVGTDMDGAHLRIFGHLIDDKNYIEALIKGDKKYGTDLHSVNKRTLGDICPDRDRAKTFIFSLFNGAAAPKVSEIFACAFDAAKEALDRFIRAYPGLAYLKKKVFPGNAQRGYFQGVDGRLVVCDSAHLMMGAVLQNTEAVLMKRANIIWRKRLDQLGIKYKQVNLVHDEFVTEVEGDYNLALRVGRIQSAAIALAGAQYGLRCPLVGTTKVGKTWLEVH